MASPPILVPASPALPSQPPAKLSDYLYPGAIHLISGSPYAGKSTLIASLLQAIKDKTSLWFGAENDLSFDQVYLILLDRGLHDNRRWLEEYGLRSWLGSNVLSVVEDPSYINAYRSNMFGDSKYPGVAEFEFILSRLNPPPNSLLVFDVFTNAITGDVGGTNWRSIRGHMTLLQSIAINRRLTILGTGYGNKIKADTKYLRGTDNASGQRPFFGALSTHMHLMSPEEQEEPFYTLFVKGRNARDLQIHLKRDPNGRFEEAQPDVEQAVEQAGMAQKKDSKSKTLLLSLMEGPVGVKELCDLSGLSRGTVSRCLVEMVESGEIERWERGVYRKVEPS